MLIWRVEHISYKPSGVLHKGPYASGAISYDEFVRYQRGRDHHPSPSDDDVLRELSYSSAYFYGFKDIAQYLKWFFRKSDRLRLHNYNMVLRAYEVPDSDVILGASQVVFLPDRAKPLATYKTEPLEYIPIDIPPNPR